MVDCSNFYNISQDLRFHNMVSVSFEDNWFRNLAFASTLVIFFIFYLLFLQFLHPSPPPTIPLRWCTRGWQCVPHHSLCFLLSVALLSAAATHAQKKRRGGRSWRAADIISRWRFLNWSSGAQSSQRRARPKTVQIKADTNSFKFLNHPSIFFVILVVFCITFPVPHFDLWLRN